MNTTSQIRQQARNFASLATDIERKNFLESQKIDFLTLSSEEKLTHFRAIEQRVEELKQKLQREISV